MACKEQHDIESWELEEVRKNDLVLKTSVEKCLVCGVGAVVRHNRGMQREAMLVYGRDGSYSVMHEEYICNNQNPSQI